MNLNQTRIWVSASKGQMAVADMNPVHAQNAYASMCRKAEHIEANPTGLRNGGDELVLAFLADPGARLYPSMRAWLENQPLMRAVWAQGHGMLPADIEDEVTADIDQDAYLVSLLSDEPPLDSEEQVVAQQMNEYARHMTALVREFEMRARALRAQYGVEDNAHR